MAGEKHIRNFPTVIICRACINRRSQQVILERIGEGALFVTDGSGYQADNRIGNNSGSQFTTCQDIVAYGYFPGDQMFTDTVVDPLIMIMLLSRDMLFAIGWLNVSPSGEV